MRKAHSVVRRAIRVPRTLDAMPHSVFLALLRANGLPEPTPEFRFAPPRRWRFDYAWPDYAMRNGKRIGVCRGSVALEVEGGAFSRGRHTRGKGFLADMEKYNEAAVEGWIVLRVTPQQLVTISTVELLQRCLTQGSTQETP